MKKIKPNAQKAAKKMGEELKKRRMAAGIVAEDVGQHFGRTTRTIYRWEAGVGVTPYFFKEYKRFLSRRKQK